MKNSVLYKKLISDQNIYNAIYSIDSYIENQELLTLEIKKDSSEYTDEFEEVIKLRDVFNEKLINQYIGDVRKKIESLIEKNEYLKAKVYFKPKKYKEDEKGKQKKVMEFRPLHSASIIEYITIVAMMQIIVYETKDLCQDCKDVNCKESHTKDKFNTQATDSECNKIVLSGLSRLIPHNFYGNKISTKPEDFIVPWKIQYKEYTEQTNEHFKKYNLSGEYRYEVNLDLENFFPSINPIIIFNYVVEHLPATYSDDEIDLIKTILIKLLYMRIDIQDDNIEILNLYYGEDFDTDISKDKKNNFLVLGLPQGLPHTYYFANLCMVKIGKIYDDVFKGKSFYYVDDSVIFTNELNEGKDGNEKMIEFKEKIDKINIEINNFEEKYYEIKAEDKYLFKNLICLDNYIEINSKKYKIKVHDDVGDEESKSWFTDITKASEGEIYLSGISRETSKTSFDLYTSQSDDEDIILKNRIFTLKESIKRELERIRSDQNKKEKRKDDRQEGEKNNKDQSDSNHVRIYEKKLLRLKKYFSYRYEMLEFKEKNNYKELCEELYKKLESITQENNMEKFIELYNNNILSTMISFVARQSENQKNPIYNLSDESCKQQEEFSDKELENYIKIIGQQIVKVNEMIFEDYSQSKPDNKERYSYFYQSNKRSYNIRGDFALHKQSVIYKKYENIEYKTLKDKVTKLYPNYRAWHNNIKEKKLAIFIEELFKNKDKHMDTLKDMFFKEFKNQRVVDQTVKEEVYTFTIVDKNSERINRMLLNTIFSHLFSLEISDKCHLAKTNNKIVSYKELRIIMFLRSPHFKFEDFLIKLPDFQNRENLSDIDYSILKVISPFKTFVSNPNQVDDLILVHRYTTEIWKNGSKYLYFYTLHNQEHAIELIINAIKIIKSISFLQISQFDYYILFIACYLHDISMVTIPSMDMFLSDETSSNHIYNDFVNEIRKESNNNDVLEVLRDTNFIKKLMNEYYQKIDEFYETKVRSNHQKDSGNEIRNRRDLDFLDDLLRDIVAEVAEAHGYDSVEVYKIKSKGKDRKVNKKFLKIILRLADVLDMSEYRVSQPILNNNLNNMSKTSAFHWLSHIVTEGYNIEVNYKNKFIDEKVIDKNQEEQFEIENNSSYLGVKTISEIITIKINVKVSQMNKEESIDCKNMNLIDSEIKNCCLKYKILDEDKKEGCTSKKCNFLCQWMVRKNGYLFNELQALQTYLNKNRDNYYRSKFYVVINVNEKTSLTAEQFKIIDNYITNDNI